ncbi:hypothetical protein [Diaphorobacter caeni]|uniref:hypothetical protein n=1 Tax=Diaphorobacter caeni TaxID=2784387 RepID=UPI00188F9938|nr:hypothetical protein [Diaphorobacter caeni]MBF5006221.1 hypothetical protein [Diaphorobacter caeni]
MTPAPSALLGSEAEFKSKFKLQPKAAKAKVRHEAHRHERSDVPQTPLMKHLTRGGCPNEATQSRSEFCRVTPNSKARF